MPRRRTLWTGCTPSSGAARPMSCPVGGMPSLRASPSRSRSEAGQQLPGSIAGQALAGGRSRDASRKATAHAVRCPQANTHPHSHCHTRALTQPHAHVHTHLALLLLRRMRDLHAAPALACRRPRSRAHPAAAPFASLAPPQAQDRAQAVPCAGGGRPSPAALHCGCSHRPRPQGCVSRQLAGQHAQQCCGPPPRSLAPFFCPRTHTHTAR